MLNTAPDKLPTVRMPINTLIDGSRIPKPCDNVHIAVPAMIPIAILITPESAYLCHNPEAKFAPIAPANTLNKKVMITSPNRIRVVTQLWQFYGELTQPFVTT